MNKIYIKGLENPKDIYTILSELYKHDMMDCMRGVETFEDKECTIIQCTRGRRRSFDDIVDIVNTYLPNTRVEEILHEILVLGVKNPKLAKYRYPCMFVCMDIRKPVLLYSNHLCPNVSGNDSYATSSKYVWTKLLRIFNISDNQQLAQYIDNYEKNNKRN